MKQPTLKELAALIENEAIARAALNEAVIGVGNAAAAAAKKIAELEEALQPFAAMYASDPTNADLRRAHKLLQPRDV